MNMYTFCERGKSGTERKAFIFYKKCFYFTKHKQQKHQPSPNVLFIPSIHLSALTFMLLNQLKAEEPDEEYTEKQSQRKGDSCKYTQEISAFPQKKMISI